MASDFAESINPHVLITTTSAITSSFDFLTSFFGSSGASTNKLIAASATNSSFFKASFKAGAAVEDCSSATAFVLFFLAISGIISALTFTFIPIFGAYTVPLLVGGKDSYMLGNVIVDQVQKTRNWPLAAAFSMVITIISIIGILWISFANNKDSKLKKSVAKEEVYLSSLNTKGIKK